MKTAKKVAKKVAKKKVSTPKLTLLRTASLTVEKADGARYADLKLVLTIARENSKNLKHTENKRKAWGYMAEFLRRCIVN